MFKEEIEDLKMTHNQKNPDNATSKHHFRHLG